ncbi:hypothetical protein M9H77_04051 [Catharanthus roseus]|uniref:Uncharacterized protein n=1 Tax=Catharanthus roseus TaxID=4058 RepID=A0ACC0CCX3_CATRO|nr:hypothetical protein M9H77_04051 [Catharanthus roseus]
MSKDEENAIFITDAQPKRVSTFKKMARLTANATGTSIRALLEPIANTEHNAAIPRMGRFTVEYGELLAIIEGCSIGSSLDDRIVIESDSLLVVNSLISNSEEISDLGSLSSVFVVV